jgi:hypothetical protein
MYLNLFRFTPFVCFVVSFFLLHSFCLVYASFFLSKLFPMLSLYVIVTMHDLLSRVGLFESVVRSQKKNNNNNDY